MPDNHPISVEAHRFVQKMPGGAQAHLIESSGGISYVVKFTNNPQHPRLVINEWITSLVLRHLGISTPEVAIVNFSPKFIRDNPHVNIQYSSHSAPPACGSHFGSRFAGKTGETRVYSRLPNAILERVSNLSDFCGVLVADKWLGNTDFRQSIFTRVSGFNLPLSFVAQMIDHGQAFDGGNWRFEDAPSRGPYLGKVFQHVRGIQSFEPWLTAVATCSKEVFEEAFQQIPTSWRGADVEKAFGKLLAQLMVRRGRVRGLIHACHERPVNPFPNWVQPKTKVATTTGQR